MYVPSRYVTSMSIGFGFRHLEISTLEISFQHFFLTFHGGSPTTTTFEFQNFETFLELFNFPLLKWSENGQVIQYD